MTLRRSHRILAISSLALLPILSPAMAQSRPRPTPAAVQSSVFDLLRGGFAQFRATLLGLLEKEGVGIDPNGKPTGTPDTGGGVDPNGATTDSGGGLDPLGRS